jgi:hypothetical protein
MHDARWSRSVLVVTLALATLLCGCRRKAPGPAECLDLAYASYGVRSTADLRIPGMKARVDELTTECLLTPYDRELVECTTQSGAARSCMRAFKLRHAGLASVRSSEREAERRRFFP